MYIWYPVIVKYLFESHIGGRYCIDKNVNQDTSGYKPFNIPDELHNFVPLELTSRTDNLLHITFILDPLLYV